MLNDQRRYFERLFEAVLWKSRLVVLMAVISGVIGAFALFVLGSYEIFKTVDAVFPLNEHAGGYSNVLIGIIGAVDLYLIGIVLLLFSFGVYELFVSKIDIARLHSEITILDIGSLDELKNKVLNVIVVVLIVTFFKQILTVNFSTPLEMLFFALAIVAVTVGVYLLRKKDEIE